MSRHRLALRPVILLAVLGCLLSSCATIPRSGPVIAGPAGSDRGVGAFQVLPEAPTRGASPEDVVRGFLRAAAGFTADHAVARLFLAPSKRLAWRPDTQVDVYPGDASLDIQLSTVDGFPAASDAVPGEGIHRVVVLADTPLTATVNGAGRYSVASSARKQRFPFGLIRVDGEWRIDQLQDGLLVSGSDFGIAFRSYPVYFVEPGGHYLVPDVHWFPDAPELPTSLVRALLNGPPGWLRGAVASGFPAGTQMAVAAVVVADGVATVDLTDQARSASRRNRQLLLAQLQATLVGLDDIQSVRITVRRAGFDVPTGPDGAAGDPAQQTQVEPQVDSRPVVELHTWRLARVDDTRVIPVAGLDRLAVPGSSRPAVSTDGSAYAVLGPQRTSLRLQLPGTARATVVQAGGTLTAPSFDPEGWVWTAPQNNAGTVLASKTDPSGVPVQAPFLRGSTVLSMRASRDGARMLLAGYHGGTPFLWLSGIIRRGDGVPLRLTQPLSVLPDITSVVDAAWVDEDQVVMLGSRSVSIVPVQPWVVQIGGISTATIPPSNALTITAGNGELALAAGTPDGMVYRAGAYWPRLDGARWPAYPG